MKALYFVNNFQNIVYVIIISNITYSASNNSHAYLSNQNDETKQQIKNIQVTNYTNNIGIYVSNVLVNFERIRLQRLFATRF